MNRADPVDMRKALIAADEFKKAGILFVPMPVTSKEDGAKLVVEAFSRLDHLEKLASEEKTEPANISDPICGNCFSPLSQHYREREIFCYSNTTGDIYKTEPPDDLIMERMAERYPDLYQALVDEWKRENGHQVKN